MYQVTLTDAEALAIRRLLWDVATEERTRHDLKVEASHWAAVLDEQAGLPAWPADADSIEEVVRFYEGIAERLGEQIASFRRHLSGGLSRPSIRASVRMFSPEAGGRRLPTIVDGYHPHIRVGDGALLGVTFRAISAGSLSPEKHVDVTIELPYTVNRAALSGGIDFDIVEGYRVVGEGIVL